MTCTLHYGPGATHNSQHGKHVTAHPRDAQENGRIQPNLLNIFILVGLEDRFVPSKHTLAHFWWPVLLIGVTDTRSVDYGIEWSKYTEGKEDG